MIFTRHSEMMLPAGLSPSVSGRARTSIVVPVMSGRLVKAAGVDKE
jgi:hypothetical protein